MEGPRYLFDNLSITFRPPARFDAPELVRILGVSRFRLLGAIGKTENEYKNTICRLLGQIST